MVAVLPGSGKDAWKSGYYGILEPDADKGTVIAPEDIDLVVCPCSSFDEDCNRMGMGGGFYDRYLPGCRSADFIAVAFETQKSEAIPSDPHDIPVDCVVTEKKCYTK
jgi:5-formyltetrahydrofolate cyclo-ligase